MSDFDDLYRFGYPEGAVLTEAFEGGGVRVQVLDSDDRFMVELCAITEDGFLDDTQPEEYYLDRNSVISLAAWDVDGEIAIGPGWLLNKFDSDPDLMYGRIMTVGRAIEILPDIVGWTAKHN